MAIIPMGKFRLCSKKKPGAYKQGEDLRPSILMLHGQIKALVQGCDFEINEAGEIKRLR